MHLSGIVSFAVLMFLLVLPNAQANYETVLARLQTLQKRYSQSTELVTLGLNDQGLPIQGLKILSRDAQPRSRHLIVGTHHGNEYHAAQTALTFIEQALENRQQEPALQERELVVFPVLNISGFNIRRREEKNSHGDWLDSNRDYPDPCARKQDFRLRSTLLLADYIRVNQIVSAATIHGYIGTFTFPWGIFTNATKTADHQRYLQWSKYAVEANDYRFGTHADVIYPAAGAFEDWAYHELGVWSFLLEIKRRSDFSKDAQALLRYLRRVPHERSASHDHFGQCEMTFFRYIDIPVRP